MASENSAYQYSFSLIGAVGAKGGMGPGPGCLGSLFGKELLYPICYFILHNPAFILGFLTLYPLNPSNP